ncbi:acetyl-CoA synthetase-like protein [Leucogyrophana mollusca]|uniref:Acetyl-CoA synthetase-like protein n=1 Tax=Leucogyrophana mollusca TaxID=85980 RepID=A0ACB8BK44_9AGAM|nr:acetyl-CoA synthetase-like protein [Leucogyrophana mollusca]
MPPSISAKLTSSVLRRAATTSSVHSALIGRTGSTRSLTLASVEGPTDPPLDRRTLSAYFKDEILGKHGDRPALICRQERPRAHGGPPSRNLSIDTHLAWDFQEFDRHINALARGLVAMGVQKGDRVAVIMGNNSAYASLQWACASIGAILVTLNPAYRLTELVNILNLVGVSHLFVVPRIRTSHYVRMLTNAFPDLRNSRPGDIQEAALPTLKSLVVVDNTSGPVELDKELYGVKSAIDWREIMVWRQDGQEQRAVQNLSESQQNDDIINLQFTSGTTGAPKAVSLTHSNLLNNALSIGRCMRLTPNDILYPSQTLILWPTRLILGNLAAWSHGSSIVYPSEIFEPKAIVDAVVEERCTALHGVPTHFLGVLAEVQKRQEAGEKLDMSQLRTGIAAGSPIPIELMRKLIEKLNLVDLTNAYGMTETSPVSFQTTPADPIIKRVETVGKVQPHVKAKIIDGEGNIVPIGTPGEICVAGYLVQKGYWGDEEQTKKVMHKDPKDESTVWMHTGDEGILDDEGYLKIVGRIKDIIIRGGENLFPVQIENAIGTNQAVQEAAAVSVPDAKYGEVVGAWVVRQPNTTVSKEDIRRTVAESMNPQNAPAWVWFVGEDGAELPKTASGKVMKHVLRDWSRDLAKKDIGRVGGI